MYVGEKSNNRWGWKDSNNSKCNENCNYWRKDYCKDKDNCNIADLEKKV